MSKQSALITTLALATTAIAPAAFAEDNVQMAMAETQNIATKAAESKTIKTRTEAETNVMSTVESSGLIPVLGPDGRIYFNRIIPISELPDPDLDIRVLETYDVNYEGDVYTNKIVQEID